MSLGAATITPAACRSTSPCQIGIESWTPREHPEPGLDGSTAAVSTGQFGVWLVNQTTGTWYEAGYFNAVAGQTSYTPELRRADGARRELQGRGVLPHRSDAVGLAGERHEPGSRDHHARRPGDQRHRAEWHGELDDRQHAEPRAGPSPPAVATGQFGVWLVNQTTGNWYEAGYFDAVALQTVYTPSFVVPTVPAGTYKTVVYYRTDPTQWVWQANGMSASTATIGP